MLEPHQMGNVTLEVTINPGTELEAAFVETYELAIRIGIGRIEFAFAGFHCVTYRAGHGYADQGIFTIYSWKLAGGLKKVSDK